MAQSRTERGFTLLEVLVALCIVAIAFGAIYKAQAQGISMTGESRDVTHAGLLAQQRMSVALAGVPPYGLRRGEFGDDWPGFRWEERVTGAKEFGAELRHVQVSVSWGPGDSARTLTLEAYVLEPAPAEEEKDTGEEGKPADKAKAGTDQKAGQKQPPADEDEGD
jgi:general secretion pathway protein I